jgi:hypothetical protein
MLPAIETCDKAKEMDENKDQPKKVSTCFEGPSFAERMQKIMGKEGIGSLCEEMMRSLIKKLNEDIQEPQKTNIEEI